MLLTGCFSPFDFDPRLERIGNQMREAAGVAAAERAAEVFDPGAPLVGGASLGSQRGAAGVRVVASNGYRPDLATADANPNAGPNSGVTSVAANSQSIMVDGAVRMLPGFRLRSERYSTMGVDALARLAIVTTTAPGDVSSPITLGYGARVGLVTDREQRQGLVVSIMRGSVPGARYDASITPTAPATASHASMRINQISATAVRLQGIVARGGWGITAGIGSNSGNYVLDQSAQLTYPDSVSSAQHNHNGAWNHGVWSVGLTRRVRQADLGVQYGHASTAAVPAVASGLDRDTGVRRSLSVGVQMRY